MKSKTAPSENISPHYLLFVSRELFWALNDYLFLIQMALNCRALRYIIMVLKKMRLLPDTILFSIAKFAMSYQNGGEM